MKTQNQTPASLLLLVEAIMTAIAHEEKGGSWGLTKSLYFEAPEQANVALKAGRDATAKVDPRWSSRGALGKKISNYMSVCKSANDEGFKTLVGSYSDMVSFIDQVRYFQANPFKTVQEIEQEKEQVLKEKTAAAAKAQAEKEINAKLANAQKLANEANAQREALINSVPAPEQPKPEPKKLSSEPLVVPTPEQTDMIAINLNNIRFKQLDLTLLTDDQLTELLHAVQSELFDRHLPSDVKQAV